MNKGIRQAHKTLGSKVRFIESSIFKIDEAVRQAAINTAGDLTNPEYPASYDVTLCYGVLYHLIEPFLALQKLAAVTKGMALVETAIRQGHWQGEHGTAVRDLIMTPPTGGIPPYHACKKCCSGPGSAGLSWSSIWTMSGRRWRPINSKPNPQARRSARY